MVVGQILRYLGPFDLVPQVARICHRASIDTDLLRDRLVVFCFSYTSQRMDSLFEQLDLFRQLFSAKPA